MHVTLSNMSLPHGAALMELFEHWYIILYYATVLSILAASTVALRWQRWPPWLNSLAFACAAGLLGGNHQVFMKGTVVLIRESVREGGSDQYNGRILCRTSS